MKALNEVGVQVQCRNGGSKRGEKRPFLDFFEVEKGTTKETIKNLKELIRDVEEYRESLKKAKV